MKDKTKTKRNQRELPDSANGDEITEYLKSLQNRADDIDNFSHPATSKTIDNDQLIQELREQDVLEAVNFGINAMRERYFEKEPKLYALGKYHNFHHDLIFYSLQKQYNFNRTLSGR